MSRAHDRFVPNAVYRGSPDNVGFRKTVITTSMSDMRRKRTCCLRPHAGHNWCLLDFRKADRYVVIISTVKGTDLFEPIF